MSAAPLYRTVYDALRDRIAQGVYPRGSALPAESRLKDDFGVSLITMRRALQELELDGYVQRRQGIGNFVREASRDVRISMSSFTSDVAAGRLRLVRTLLADELIPAPEGVAEKLGGQPASLVRRLVRLDAEGSVPLSVDEAYIPPALAGHITPDIAASPLFMHLWQEASGLSFSRTLYDIRAEVASDADQRLLLLDEDTPILVTGELVFDASGRPVLFVTTRYRGDRSRLSGTVTLARQRTPRGVVGE